MEERQQDNDTRKRGFSEIYYYNNKNTERGGRQLITAADHLLMVYILQYRRYHSGGSGTNHSMVWLIHPDYVSDDEAYCWIDDVYLSMYTNFLTIFPVSAKMVHN